MQTPGRQARPAPAGSGRLLRSINERAALYHLLEHGTLTRVELRELTGLAKPTASHVMLRLLESGLAVTVGRATTRQVGPKAEVYAVNADYAFAAAATLREPDGVTVAVSDLRGRQRASAGAQVDFDSVEADRAVSDLLAATAADAGIDLDRVRVLHLAVPGAHDPDTDTIDCSDIPGLTGRRLRTALSERLRVPVQIHNDVNAATVAERRSPDTGDGLALLWLGREGIGVGVDLGSGLLVGEHGAAGELGYVPAFADRSGPDDPTFQDWLGAEAVVALGRAHGIGGDAEAVMAAAVERGAESLLVDFADRVAAAVRLLGCLIDPPRIVLAGEVAAAGGEVLVRHVRSASGRFGDRVAPSAVEGDPVAIGVLDSAYADLKSLLLDSALEGAR